MTMLAPAALTTALRDRYQLLAVIGRGGMATVYKAHDIKHDRTVALKVLHEDLAASLGPERFKREILIAARLQHPHILSVFDSGEAGGRLWFTMPFVQGESLRDLLRREGKLPVETALLIVREAAQALAHAHKQGVIHRDIKPENILLTEDGSTLVADFGIARAMGDGSFEQGLTQTGSAIGTPTYMAPEQATGETVLDERVDQYALAAVLYELLTGAPPFTGANAAALIAARFTSSVTPLRTQRPEVPAEVDAAVQRALGLKPADRFPTIAEFARAVAPSISTPQQFDTRGRPRSPVPQRASLGRWRYLIGAMALLVVGGAALRWRTTTAAAPADAGPIRIAVLPLQNLGDSADAYFADGMSDELRASLVSLPGMQVIARASSMQFVGSTKTPAQIAEELNVRYLLTGTLRYERRADGSNAVRVRPELMEVTGAGPATTRWQATFDEPLTNAPALQSKIASQVALQLQLALGTSDRTRLAKPPTSNPEAYDAYLRGTANLNTTAAGRRQRVADLERAVALDPGFGMAWAMLARARANVYSNIGATPELAGLVREAAERARSAAPGEPAEHLAWAIYHRAITNDLQAAEREARAALKVTPNDPESLARLATIVTEQGRPDEALPLYEMATRLDPLNRAVWSSYGTMLLTYRRYAEARAPLERAALLGTTSQQAVLMQVALHAATGDLAAARRVISDAYRRFPADELDTFLAMYLDFGWILSDSAQQRVLAAPASAFDDERGTQAFVRAQILAARGDRPASRRAAAEAVSLLAVDGERLPDDPQWPYFRAVAAALAGQSEVAERLMAEGDAVERRIKPRSEQAAYFAELRARAHTLNGQYDRAFDEIEGMLAKPGFFGRGNLALDPTYAPLRTLPRYQRIMTTASPLETR